MMSNIRKAKKKSKSPYIEKEKTPLHFKVKGVFLYLNVLFLFATSF